jgi:8-oxo-dGTP pyrophosphatase MutT (NUDIX family)
VQPDRATEPRPAATVILLRDRAEKLEVLLVQRNPAARFMGGLWVFPGGAVDAGETARAAGVREVAEEAGVEIAVTGLSGVYTDPGHIMVYRTGEVRQQFAVCFHALPLYGDPHPDDHETCDAAWVPTDRLHQLDIHPTMRRRITDALSAPSEPHID